MKREEIFRKILVPVDGSLHSLIAEELTASIAKKLNSKVTVLHVVSHELMIPERHEHVAQGVTGSGQFPIERHVSTSTASSLPEAVTSEITSWFHQKGEQVIAEAVGLFQEEGIPVDQKIVHHANPAEAIIKEAQVGKYDVIIMGSRGEEEEGKESHLGSVAQRASRHSHIPVLIAREKRQISRILVPVDGSRNAEKALQYAILLAKKTNAKITLLYVQESSLFKLRPEVTKQIGTHILANAADQADEMKLDQKLEFGDPGKMITRTASEGDYDIIVMGSHGHGAIERFLLGSVSDHVIHYANRSVLIIK